MGEKKLGIQQSSTDTDSPLVPLSSAARAAYQAIYDNAQAAMQKTTDGELLQSLDQSRLNAAAVISADNAYRINANTTTYEALAHQINTTNDGLKKLQTDIAGVADKIDEIGQVADGIATVLELVPGI